MSLGVAQSISYEENSCNVKTWLHEEFETSGLQVKRIKFDQSRQWIWDQDGFISHRTKRFFRIVGVRYFSLAEARVTTQPIIDQPEIGLLSFLVCREGREWWILAHAKAEPGNVNGVQLAPTVQATKSNYEIAHGGSATPYLKWVQSGTRALCCHLQSEQNSRFLAKRNQNSTILLPHRIPAVDSRFRWIRLCHLFPLLREDHTVNTDARSVLVCWLFTDSSALKECAPADSSFAQTLVSSLDSKTALHQTSSLYNWLNDLSHKYKSNTVLIPLRKLEHPWECGGEVISSPDNPAMSIHHIEVQCAAREVAQWDQPISSSQISTRIVLLIGSLNGTLHLLLQARLEAGNRSGFELTTTVQADMPENDEMELPYLQMAKEGKTVLRFRNSEEGGRFDCCVSEYEIIRVDKVSQSEEGPFHRWVSLAQFSEMLAAQRFTTNELRSAVSSLLSVEQNE